MNYAMKWPEAKPIPRANSQQVSRFIYEEVICRHGCPELILSDRGTHFRNEMVKELLRTFQIKQLFSMPYHPRTNGLVEQFNCTLYESLAKSVTQEQE